MDTFKFVGSYIDKQNYVCLVQIPIALSPSPASLPEKSASGPRRLSRVGCRCAGTFLRVHRSTEVAASRSRSTGSVEEDTEVFAPVSPAVSAVWRRGSCALSSRWLMQCVCSCSVDRSPLEQHHSVFSSSTEVIRYCAEMNVSLTRFPKTELIVWRK